MFGFLKKESKAQREIVVNVESLETRVAVMECGRLEEFQVEHPTEERIVGSIFKGKIQNLEHDLQAAFVDIGLKKNAFLHYWDMMPDDASRIEVEEGCKRRRTSRRKRFSNEEISKQFPPGSEIVVQVTKGPIGTKGPRVTASLSIPGRYLVMMPGVKLKGVSRKIGDVKARQRLKKVLMRLPVPKGIGLIMRTAAITAGKRGIARDLRGLIAIWEDLQKAIVEHSAPSCLYHEPDLVERVVRDWLTEDINRITVDSVEHFERIRNIAARISRKAKSCIHLYEGDLPIFDHYDVEKQLEETFCRKVNLPSGGYLVFDETEALVAIDVNTGKHKGRGSQDEAILIVNTEAVIEVARQLRLRNVGGLVLIDLIDMKPRKHQNSVFRKMKESLRRDHARTNVLPISELGIMEMTRQRAEESILSSMHIDCPYCHGRGAVRSPLGMSVDIHRQIAAIMRRIKKSDISYDLQIIVHPTVMDRLRNEDEKFLMDLQSRFDGKLSFKSDPSKHVENFVINNAANGEVLYSRAEK
ncbi:MAG: Rne/Rng family ribonuclease [Kiritimatiellae bacterium]|nr:Rne/Rng family ribonuclease [Kiritimatiellia bacterium]